MGQDKMGGNHILWGGGGWRRLLPLPLRLSLRVLSLWLLALRCGFLEDIIAFTLHCYYLCVWVLYCGPVEH